MAKSGRSWNDSKSARARAAGSSQANAESAAGSSPPAAAGPASGGGRASWRDKSAGTVADQAKSPYWRISRTENPNRLRHRMKLAIAALALAVLVGYYLVTVFFRPQNTPLLLVGLLDYAAPFAPNAWTAEDFERFRATFLSDDGPGSVDNIRIPAGLDGRQWTSSANALLSLEQKLADLNPGGPGNETVLIYLSGHGILDAEGRPCLVLPTMRGNQPTWRPQLNRPEDLPLVEVQEILNRIGDAYDGQDVKKVVLLDANRIQSNPRLGILQNRFVDALKNLQFADENLFLVSSADVGQSAWTLPDMGGTAFGYYVCKGLEGQADGASQSAPDDEVTLDELCQYLRREIAVQVRNRYVAVQAPLLLPANSAARAKEIRLTWTNRESTPEEASVEPTPPVDWRQIDALWKRHTDLKETPIAALSESTERWLRDYQLGTDRPAMFRGPDVLSWEAFQQGLLRLEELNLAGRYYTNQAQRLYADLQQLAERLSHSADAAAFPPELALRAVAVPPGVQQQVDSLIKAPPKEPELLIALQKLPYSQRAKAVWNYWLRWANSVSPTSVAEYRRTIDGVLAAPPDASTDALGVCDSVEIRFLRLLDPRDFAPAELFADQAIPLQAAILSRDLSEAAAWATEDPRVHYAIQDLVARGDAARRREEDRLFVKPAEAAAGRKSESHEYYKQAMALAVELSAAFEVRDQASQELPYLARWLVLRNQTETEQAAVPTQLSLCQGTIAANQQLALTIGEMMDKLLTSGQYPNEEARQKLVKATESVRGSLTDLIRFHRDAISDSNRAGAVDVLDRRRIHDLLSTPLVSGAERSALRQSLLRSKARAPLNAGEFASKSETNKLSLASHPLLPLYGADVQVSDADLRLDGALRAALKKRFDDLRGNAESAVGGANRRADRSKLAAPEHEARALAALCTW
jgi:hypothetical protein